MGFIKNLTKLFNETKENINLIYSSEIKGKNQVELKIKVPKEIQEIYRKTIFLYAESINSKIKKSKDYVGYLNYECGITNPDIYHRQLINEGYYELSSFSEKLEQLKLPELKAILQDNNLPTKGKKAELIKLIVEEIPENKVNLSKEEMYSLSEKGRCFLEENKNFVELHRYKNYQISLEDYYNATKDDKYKRNFNDVAWQIFNERTLLYQQNNEYSSERYNYFHMANLLLTEGKKEHALQLFLYCLVIDLSGVESINMIELYKSRIYNKKEFLEHLEYNCLIPSLINQIVELKECYDESMIEEAYSQMYLPFNVSTLEYIKELIKEACNTAVFDFDKYKNILIQNKKKVYLQLVK